MAKFLFGFLSVAYFEATKHQGGSMRCSFSLLVVGVGAVLLGILLAVLTLRYSSPVSGQYAKWRKRRETPHSQLYRDWLQRNHIKETRGDANGRLVVPEAAFLRSTVKLLCWVMLNGDGEASENLWPYAPSMGSAGEAIQQTWGQRCAHTVYFSSKPDATTKAVVLSTADLHSWMATHEAIMHLVGAGYLDKYDWFYRAEEDTFPIIENLLYYLSVRNASDPAYLGHAYSDWGTAYNVEGPGYVLSRTALRHLHTKLLKGHCGVTSRSAPEGPSLAHCLAEAGIATQDTRDTLGRARFLVHAPDTHLVLGNLPWTEKFWRHSLYVSPEGPNCCSDYAIAFHHVTPNMIHVMEYLIYHLKPFGITASLALPADQALDAMKRSKQGIIHR